jgi:cell division protein FtsB
MFSDQKRLEVRIGYLEDETEALKREVESLREEVRDLKRIVDLSREVSASDGT